MVFSPKARMAVCCVAILGIALAIHAQDGVVHSEGGQPTGPSRRFGVPVKAPAQDPISAPVLPVAASGTILTASDVSRIIEAATKSVAHESGEIVGIFGIGGAAAAEELAVKARVAARVASNHCSVEVGDPFPNQSMHIFHAKII